MDMYVLPGPNGKNISMSVFITHVYSLFYKIGIILSTLLFTLLFAFQQFTHNIFPCQHIHIQVCLILLFLFFLILLKLVNILLSPTFIFPFACGSVAHEGTSRLA